MLIVDTYNVLHTTGVLPPRLAAPGVPGLVRLIGRSRYARRRITLVCDGGGRSSSGYRMGSVHILYAGHGREADDVIEDLIVRYHRGNTLDVVSSDRRLRRAAGRRGAGSITSACFLAHLVEDERRPPKHRGGALRKQVPLDPYSVAQWLGEFGYPATPAPPKTQTDPAHADRTAHTAPVCPGSSPAEALPSEPGPRRRVPPVLVERLRVDPPPAVPVSRQADDAAPPKPISAGASDGSSVPSVAPAHADPIDPLLLEALQEWRDRLSLDDLDMERWLPDE